MRFFNGVRGSTNKPGKISASQRFKDQASGKVVREKTPEEKYKDMMEAKIQKLTEDAMMGKKKGSFRLPGSKEEAPKEMSKNAKLMMKLLAMQKLQKDAKKEKKRLKEEMWKMKAEKRSKALAKANEEWLLEGQKRAEEEAAAAATAAASQTSSSSYWGVGPSSSDDNSGW